MPDVTSSNSSSPKTGGPQLIGADSFKRVKELPAANSITWMEYGGAKSGKTMFMASAGPRTLFLNNGSGIETIKSPLAQKKYPGCEDMLTVEISEELDANGLPEHATAFDKYSHVINFALMNYFTDFDTICLDDSTSARRHAMYKGLEINLETGKSKTLADVKKFDVMQAAVQDYGIEMNIILQFFVKLIETCKKYDKHLIVGAHERYTLKKGDKIGELPSVVQVRPGFTGQTMPDDIGGLWDILTHTEKVGGGSNIIYRHRFNGDEITQAGVRYGGVFETVESDVNFLKCVERIKAQQLNPKAAKI